MLKLIKTMLDLGKECGLRNVSESYSNLMLHWDAFFTYENYGEEERAFHEEMKRIGLLVPKGQVHDDLYYSPADMSIDEALEIVVNESLRSLQK